MVLAGNDLRKSFGGVEAVRGVSIEAHPGSVLALLGENGAGKSTLVRILAGDCSPDAGTITIDEHVYTSLTPRTAKNAGIRLVSQELAHAPDLTVAENIVLGDWPRRRGFVSWRSVRGRASEALDRLGSALTPSGASGISAWPSGRSSRSRARFSVSAAISFWTSRRRPSPPPSVSAYSTSLAA